MLKLPTNQEIDKAGAESILDGPVPLAAIVDGCRSLYIPLLHSEEEVNSGNCDLFTTLKAMLVLGLNIGIRIGENRVASQKGL
jgi:hypothetical protein